MKKTTNDNLQEVEKEARKQVRELKRFYTHLFLFSIISVFLAALSVVTSPGFFWAIFPILAWGTAVCIHAISVFGFFGIGSKAWEERKVQELVLAQQKGLDASQVRALLREELYDASKATPAELSSVVARLENIEAIVTSQAWDNLPERNNENGRVLLPSDEEDELNDTAKAERIARRVR